MISLVSNRQNKHDSSFADEETNLESGVERQMCREFSEALASEPLPAPTPSPKALGGTQSVFYVCASCTCSEARCLNRSWLSKLYFFPFNRPPHRICPCVIGMVMGTGETKLGGKGIAGCISFWWSG